MTATVYIVLFRGVGGKTQLPTAPLREKLAEAGFQNVATYINSGNAVLKTDLPRALMLEQVAAICRAQFGFDKAIYARTLAEWDALIAANPFADTVEPGNQLHAAVLDGVPQDNAVEALRAVAVDGERIAVAGQVAYLHTPNGFGRSKLGEKFDKGLGVPNTARNWNTVLKLRQLAETASG